MKKLIPVINKLMDVFNTVGIQNKNKLIDLPMIAVVGEQSVGKSSVLETIVGHDFLPRGNTIVTRRPLILKLYYTPNSSMRAEMLDQSLEAKKIPYVKKFKDWEKIKQGIKDVTEKCAPGKDVSEDPISLSIYSEDVIDLTLVDLPGITKNPVKGQRKDIEYVIKKMVMNFITKPNCLILAVAPANVDLANSIAIKMANTVDKPGERTIGVLTKIDIMDKGTSAIEVLNGNQIKLKTPWIGVKLRCQADIISGKSIKESLDEEINFFQSHQDYKSIADRQGVKYLTKTLNKILLSHIRKTLPDIRMKIEHLISKARERIAKYGPPLDDLSKATLLQKVNEFFSAYKSSIEGQNIDNTRELFGGARINWIFYKKFLPVLYSIEPTKNLTDDYIKLRIKISKGARNTLYLPENAFDSLVKMQIKRLESPAIRCCDQVFNELVFIIDHCLKGFVRFPTFKEKIRRFTIDLLKSYMSPLKQHLKHMIKCELAYTNTNHQDFFGSSTKIHSLMDQIRSSHVHQQSNAGPIVNGQPIGGQKPKKIDREKMEVDVIRTLLGKYFKIIRKQIGDATPKAIMYFLVNMTVNSLQTELINHVYSMKPEDVLKESPEIKQKRTATMKMLNILLQAQEIISELGDADI